MGEESLVGYRVGVGKIVSKNLRWGLIFHAYSLLGSVVTVASREDQETCYLSIHPSVHPFFHPSSSQPNFGQSASKPVQPSFLLWVLKIKRRKTKLVPNSQTHHIQFSQLRKTKLDSTVHARSDLFFFFSRVELVKSSG